MSGLIVLKERVDATEALIAIDLDNRRNDLVAFDLVCHPSCSDSSVRFVFVLSLELYALFISHISNLATYRNSIRVEVWQLCMASDVGALLA